MHICTKICAAFWSASEFCHSSWVVDGFGVGIVPHACHCLLQGAKKAICTAASYFNSAELREKSGKLRRWWLLVANV